MTAVVSGTTREIATRWPLLFSKDPVQLDRGRVAYAATVIKVDPPTIVSLLLAIVLIAIVILWACFVFAPELLDRFLASFSS